MRFLILLALLGLLIFGFIMVIGSMFTRRGTRHKMRSAINESRQKRDAIWKEAANIQDMVRLYMVMVAKHGPDSVEAKAFRYGTDSRLMRELHSDDEAMEAFSQQADIVDETYRSIRR